MTKSYVFLAELLQEEDGRWSAGVPSLPGCATWGFTREEALRNLRDAVEAYVRDVQEASGEIPKEASAEVRDQPLIAVTVCPRPVPRRGLLRNVPTRRIAQALERDGFSFTERQGSQRIYRHRDGRRVVIHYHRATDTLTPYVLRNPLAGTRWTEDDLRRLKLIK